MKILVMGLPGSGKTTFSQELVKRLMINHSVAWFNADSVRQQFKDWDFTDAGRRRQVDRMIDLSRQSTAKFVICDFVCPTEELRKRFNADIIIWLDTIKEGRFEDTNKLFTPPSKYHYRIQHWDDNDFTINRFINDNVNYKDSRIRSFTKALSWRFLGSLDTFILSWIITDHIIIAATIGGVELITKTILFYFHERLWTKIKIK